MAKRSSGVFFYLATGVAILIAVDASSRDALWMFLVGAAVWLTIAVVWFIRFAVTASSSRLRMPSVEWVRWMVIPVADGPRVRGRALGRAVRRAPCCVAWGA